MLFQTPEFFLFILTVLVLYWGVLGKNYRAQNLMLLCASFVFYGWWDWRFLGLILFSTLVDYQCGRFLDRRDTKDETRWAHAAAARKKVLLLSLICNLGLLGFFKYYNFFTEGLANLVWAVLAFEVEVWVLEVAVPVGISFYTFQSLSYTIDIYRGQLRARRSFLDFALFVAFFPQLVAGPIVRATEMLPQIESRRTFDWPTVHRGVWLIFGVCSKKRCLQTASARWSTSFTDLRTPAWARRWP